MSAYLITYTAVAFATLALTWVVREFNFVAGSLEQHSNRLEREADASWARTLASLEHESAERRAIRARTAAGK